MGVLTLPSVAFRNRRYDVYASTLLLVAGVVLALAIPVLVNREAGPDAWTLWTSYARADNCDFWSPFSESRSSYECTAYVLRPTGIDLYNAWIYGAICNLLLTTLPLLFFRRIPLSILGAMLVWAVIRGFFLENLTKEILVGATVIVMLFASLRRHPIIGIAAAAMIYGIMIRPYWVLVAMTWLGLVVIRPRLNAKRFLLMLPLFYLTAAVAIHALTGGTLTGFRQSSNEMRTLGEEGSKSLIVSLLGGGDVVSQALDTLLILFRLVFPVELIKLSGAQQAVFVALSTITAVFCARAFLDRRPPRRSLPLLAFPVAFLMIQAIFEPDFGSFARHFSMVAPIAFGGIGIWLAERQEQRETMQ